MTKSGDEKNFRKALRSEYNFVEIILLLYLWENFFKSISGVSKVLKNISINNLNDFSLFKRAIKLL